MTSNRDRRARVVIGDDHPSVLAAFTRMLEPHYEVVAAVTSGDEAVQAAAALRPDVLVVDLMMGDMDGLKVCRAVRQAAPETAIVVVTAFADTQVQAAVLQEGAAAFVPKQQAAESLVETIGRVLAERREHPARTE